jgi:hypothetical protein
MQDNHTPTDISKLYAEYLHGQGSITITSLLSPDSPLLLAIARIQDGIGFDNLLVGDLSCLSQWNNVM